MRNRGFCFRRCKKVSTKGDGKGDGCEPEVRTFVGIVAKNILAAISCTELQAVNSISFAGGNFSRHYREECVRYF
jgi:hypothetical protein